MVMLVTAIQFLNVFFNNIAPQLLYHVCPFCFNIIGSLYDTVIVGARLADSIYEAFNQLSSSKYNFVLSAEKKPAASPFM